MRVSGDSQYEQKVRDLLKVNPNITDKEVMRLVGCGRRTFYRVKAQWVKEGSNTLKEEIELDKQLLKEHNSVTRYKIDSKKERIKRQKKEVGITLLPKAQWQSFKEFVGWVEYRPIQKALSNDSVTNVIQASINCRTNATQKIECNTIVLHNGIECERIEHRGQAIPEPIDLSTNEFKGLFWYQEEGFQIIESHDNVLILWPRGHGKTWLMAWWIEWNMKHSRFKCLYLSVTDVINDVADWVFEWADVNDLLAEGAKAFTVTKNKGRRNTPKKFTLVNGSVFHIFYVKDRDIRGKHDFTIIMDDIIDEGSERNPTYQADLRRRWNASISKVRRNKLVIVNTRVYEGDFIDELIQIFKNRFETMNKRLPEQASKWALYIDLKTPYKYAKEGELQDDDGYALDPLTQERLLLAPELYTHDFFEAMKAEDYVSFMAEMMQDPTSLGGGLISYDDILFNKRPIFSKAIEFLGIGVDLSWTESSTSDMCAVVSILCWSEVIEKKRVKRFSVIKADVDRMPLFTETRGDRTKKGVFDVIQEQSKFLLDTYQNIPLRIAIERNSGGIAIINQAVREKLPWVKYLIVDHATAVKWAKNADGSNVPYGITHSKEKVARIFGELQKTIKSHEMEFDWELESSIGMAQLLVFPNGKHDDFPDALGMIKDELNKVWTPDSKPRDTRNKEHEAKEEFGRQWDLAVHPWKQQQQLVNRMEERRRLQLKRLGFGNE